MITNAENLGVSFTRKSNLCKRSHLHGSLRRLTVNLVGNDKTIFLPSREAVALNRQLCFFLDPLGFRCIFHIVIIIRNFNDKNNNNDNKNNNKSASLNENSITIALT